MDPTKNLEVTQNLIKIDNLNKGRINKFSHEILLHIFSFLSAKDLCLSVELTSKFWRKLASDNLLWKRLIYFKFHKLSPSIFKEEVMYKDLFRRCCGKLVLQHTINVGSRVLHVIHLSGGKLASGSDDGIIRIWDIENGKCLHNLEGNRGQIFSLTLLPEGKLTSGSNDGIIRIWDIENGKCLRTLKGKENRSWIRSLTLLPEGKLASGSNKGFIRIWG